MEKLQHFPKATLVERGPVALWLRSSMTYIFEPPVTTPDGTPTEPVGVGGSLRRTAQGSADRRKCATQGENVVIGGARLGLTRGRATRFNTGVELTSGPRLAVACGEGRADLATVGASPAACSYSCSASP